MEFWQPGSYGSLCVGDFNHAANREDRIPNQSGCRLQARDQETKLASALVQSDPTPAQSLIQKATFSACNSNSYRVTYFFLEFESTLSPEANVSTCGAAVTPTVAGI